MPRSLLPLPRELAHNPVVMLQHSEDMISQNAQAVHIENSSSVVLVPVATSVIDLDPVLSSVLNPGLYQLPVPDLLVLQPSVAVVKV